MDCPFINDNHPNCSVSLNMNKLEEAFDLCTYHYMLCPLYLKLSENLQETHEAVAAGQIDTKK